MAPSNEWSMYRGVRHPYRGVRHKKAFPYRGVRHAYRGVRHSQSAAATLRK